MLTGVDLHFVARELKVLLGARIKKIYSKGENIYFHFYNQGQKYVMKILQGKAVFLSDKEEYDSYPSNFCMTLRKYLMNAKLKEIRQKGIERIIEFAFSKHDDFIVIVELIKPGNIILCNKDYEIIFPLKIRKFSTRWIKPREKYALPNPKKSFDSLINSDKDSVVKAVAMDLGFGGDYSEEILKRAGISKTVKPQRLSPEQINLLKKTSLEMLNEKISASLSDKPCPIEMRTKLNGKKYENFRKY